VDKTNFEKINLRIKQLRKALNMTQAGFSQVISLSSGYLAGIETEKRKVNNRIIKLICSSFNANEHWLRRGDGEMFTQNENEQFIKLIGLFRELEPRYQDYIFKEISLLLKMQVDGDDSQADNSPEEGT
jgi:transcriptional regulator with XRE-family HTH domain